MMNDQYSMPGAGSQDSGFGTNGNVFIAFRGFNNNDINGVTVTGDTIYVADQIYSSTHNPYGLGRLTMGGDADTQFNGNGQVTGTFADSVVSRGQQVTVIGEKLLLSGTAMNNRGSFSPALARHFKDGRLDTSFGNNGSVILDFDLAPPAPPPPAFPPVLNTSSQAGVATVVLPDGKLLLSSTYSWGLGSGIPNIGLILRLTADGKLDKSFNQIGYVAINAPDDLGTSIQLTNILVQSDGNYVACGSLYSHAGINQSMLVRCLAKNGDLDSAFGDRGFAVIPSRLASTNERLYQVIEDTGSKMLLGIGGTIAVSYQGIVVGIDNRGQPDRRFNQGEALYMQLEESSTLWVAAAQQQDGKLVVAGGAKPRDKTFFNVAVARVTLEGNLDTTFGNGKGWVLASIHEGASNANAVAIQSDGKILVGGTASGVGLVTRLLGDPSIS